jgi:FlaA1/EpsC-like NDP-sugar epimerase
MTIPEACELILTAAAATRMSEPADSQVYVLDMGEPVKIVSLAERMIQLHGLRPGHDIEITITGLRPGEKLYEELAHEAEELMPAPIAKAHLAPSRAPQLAVVEKAVARLIAVAGGGSRDEIILALQELVPEFKPDLSARTFESSEMASQAGEDDRDGSLVDSAA